MVASAVREMTTKLMLTTKPRAMAVSSAASGILLLRRNVRIGKASATAHSANSWL